MKRVVTPELLDADAWTQAELGSALADLDLINRLFGGISTTASLLKRVSQKTTARELSVLDVGGANGTVMRKAAERLSSQAIKVSVAVVDRAPSHLDGNGVAGDATALPFRRDSFDVVGCSLLAHHLSPDELKQFVREGLRMARRAVVINDLRRSPVHLALVYAGFPLFRSKLTRNDGPASVRAAYTPEEIRELLPGMNVEIRNHYLYRMGVIVWKN
jgi:2-polyprenyl-3-methyl-5-hydroxy-6-metoxy-1,4-benzoquinol methylase